MSKLLTIFMSITLFASVQSAAFGKSGYSSVYRDSSILVREINGSKIYLTDGVTDQQSWAQTLSLDTVLISYFTQKTKEPLEIYISEITSLGPDYKFRIMVHEKFTEEKLIKQLKGFGYSYYAVRVITDVKPVRRKIVSIQYVAAEI